MVVFHNLVGEPGIGFLVDALVEKVGNPEAVCFYESFNAGFVERYGFLQEKYPGYYKMMKRDAFEKLLRDEFGLEVDKRV